MMGHEIRADYDQMFLLPPDVEDWVPGDHPARFIRDFVDSLDLKAMGFRVSTCEVGRPSYAADLLLKVWLYGYFSKIRSTRSLEKACRENMGLIWLTGMNTPDHNSLWRFFRDHKEQLKGIFKQTVQVAAKCKLIGMVVNALDGTKIRATSNSNGVVNSEGLEKMLERLDRSSSDFMTEIERREQEEIGEYRLPPSMHSVLRRKNQIQKALRELEESEKQWIHHCEPEARFMKNQRTIELSYNAQAVADKDNGIIVAQDVVNDGTDNGQLVPMLDQVHENVGMVAQENLADTGYYSSSQIGLAEARSYDVLVNAPPKEIMAQGPETNPYHTLRFVYDEQNDCCICPHGQVLVYSKTKVRGRNRNEFRVYRCREYRTCPHSGQCSRNKKGREISISVHQAVIERQRAKRKDPEKKRLLALRKAIIEPVFAWIKRHLAFDRWTVYGLGAVKAQWCLVCSTINLKKLYNHWKSGRVVLACT
jgi:transposase